MILKKYNYKLKNSQLLFTSLQRDKKTDGGSELNMPLGLRP